MTHFAQALVWAHNEPRYNGIKTNTKGVVFLATPHRGSKKADYGKILVNVATGVMNRPRSGLIRALKANSGTFEELTSEFKFQASSYQIVSFYELKSMSMVSRPVGELKKHSVICSGTDLSQIVERHSVLLEVNNEIQQSVDSNQSKICKFDSRHDQTYQKLVKRLKRISKHENILLQDTEGM